MGLHKYYDVREVSSLKDLIVSNGEIFGNKPAFLYKKERGGEYFEISHKKFSEDVDALGTYLLENGFKDKKIGVIGVNCYQWEVAYFATVNGVGTVIPLDKELKKEEVLNLMKRAECDTIFYTEEYAEYLENEEASFIENKFKMSFYHDENHKEAEDHIEHLLEKGRVALEGGNKEFVEAEVDVDACSVILFTSGTTGDAKGAMISHKNLVRVILDTGLVEDFRGERSLSILPIHHTFEAAVIMVILHQGGSVAFYEGLKYIIKNLQESKASMVVAVPLIVESIYNRIWTQAKKSGKDKTLVKGIKITKLLKKIGIDKRRAIFKDLYANFGGELKTFLCGAAALNPNVAKGLMDLGFEVYQGYGLTECAPLITATCMYDDIYNHAGSCGKVVPNGSLRIENPDSSGIGEICFKGDNVMLGYYKSQEKTDEVIKNGWFYTGDLGFVDPDGWLYITGRQKNVIVTKTGKNIYPEEIEAEVNNIPFVKDCMVYGLEEEEGGSDTKVAVQILPDYEMLKEEYGKEELTEEIEQMFKDGINELNRKMSDYKRIRNVIVRKEDFVRTTSKKIKRAANLD